MPLKPKYERFVQEYLIHLSPMRAAEACGFGNPRVYGHTLLKRPEIAEAISAGMMARRAARVVEAEEVLQRLTAIATADANDVVQYRRGCCRHCWGIDGEYQWIDAKEWEAAANAARVEWSKAADAAEALKIDPPPLELPSDAGGYGYNPHIEPNRECVPCNGEGEGYMHITDSRLLTGGARMLYAGVKQTRFGVEVVMESRAEALAILAKHLGIGREQVDLNLKATTPIINLVLNGADDQAAGGGSKAGSE